MKKDDMMDMDMDMGSGVSESAMDGQNLVMDLTDVDENSGGFEAMPKGDYECIVDDVEYGKSKAGSPMITWKFKVVSPEFANRVLFYYNVLDKSFGVAMLKKTLISCNLDINMKEFDPQTFADNGDGIGASLMVKVGIQKYQGEKRNTVKDVGALKSDTDFGSC